MAVLALVGLILSACAGGQAPKAKWPEKPVTVVVGWAPGGLTDLQARVFASLMAKYVGGEWVVVNKPGASGSVGAQEVAVAPKDGYTVHFTAESLSLFKVLDLANLGPDDFEILGISGYPMPTITVPASSRFQTIQQLVEEARNNPGKVSVAIAGTGATAHVVALMMEKYLGTKFNFVPFKGGSEAVAAAVGGQVDVTCEAVMQVMEFHKAGKLRILAAFGPSRHPALPDVPAIGEVYPEAKDNLEYGPYYGFVVPKGVPADVVNVMSEGTKKAFQDQEWLKKQAEFYLVPVNATGDQAREFVNQWTSRMTWFLYEVGLAKKSPAEFGIPKPK